MLENGGKPAYNIETKVRQLKYYIGNHLLN